MSEWTDLMRVNPNDENYETALSEVDNLSAQLAAKTAEVERLLSLNASIVKDYSRLLDVVCSVDRAMMEDKLDTHLAPQIAQEIKWKS